MSEKLKRTPVIGHTPEPWNYFKPEHSNGLWYINDSCMVIYGLTHLAEANAARIVACVNACAGMEYPEYEIQSLKTDLEFFKNENEVLRTMVSDTPPRYDYIPLFIFISIIGFWAAIVTGLIILFS